jgi:2-methylcitrate dehydratase
MKAKVKIELKNGGTLTREQEDYHGFFTRPFSWDEVIESSGV